MLVNHRFFKILKHIIVYCQVKMLFLLSALLIFFIFKKTANQDPQYWEKSHQRQFFAKLLALTSIVLWIGIVFAGRWIAYL